MKSLDILRSLLLLAALLNFALGFFVLLKNYSNMVSRAFGAMSLTVSVWALIGFVFNIVGTPEQSYFYSYVLYCVAAILPATFLVMTLVFPPYSLLSKKLSILLIIEALLVLIVTIVPGWVIGGFQDYGGILAIRWGPLYFVYVFHHIIFFLAGYLVLMRKYHTAKGVVQSQIQYIILGTFVPANLALTTNLIMPWFGVYDYYTWLGQIFMIFLVFSSAYAIFKHKLFNLKIIATETFVIAASLILLIRFIVSSNPTDRWLGGAIFIAVTIFGVLLIRSVWNEVEQRNRLQSLTKQLEKANVKLKTLDQARAEFISIASHQLRTPPATIKWYLGAILQGDYGKLNPKIKASLERAQMTNNTLIALIDDMLNVSRIERGKLEFIFEPIDLHALTLETVLELQPQAKLKQLNLEYTPPKTKIPLITADKEKLQQVINNLIDNAIKYSKSGEVQVVLKKTGGEVQLTVTDDGKGMNEDEKLNLFKKFSRSKDSKNHAAGLGLGLYVAKVIIEQHKGKIWADSPGPGQGSTFGISLPIKNGIKRQEFDLAEK